MKKAIEALTEVVRELKAGLEKLPDTIAEKLTEALAAKAGTESDPEGKGDDRDEPTEDEVRAIVRAAAEEVITVTTGKLPE